MTATSVSRAHRRSRPIRTQPFRILVASSAEPSSLGAIRFGAALARRRSGSVHALIVAAPFPHALPSDVILAPPAFIDADNRRTSLDLLRRQLATARGTRDWTMRATTGFAADAIVDAGARWPASLIVMGTGEHRLADRLLGSETAVNVAIRTTVPLLIVPANARELPTRAVAAVDFSAASIDAAMFAASLLGPNGTLTLLYASALIVEDSPAGSLTDIYTTGVRDQLEELARSLHRRSKRPVSFAVANGAIVDRLLDHVDEHGSDLIALGAHEPTLLERLLIGRVRTRVIREAPCSVLVMPPAASEEP